MSRIVLSFYNTAKACLIVNAYTYIFVIVSLAAPYTASAKTESKTTQSNNSKSARINENNPNKTNNCNTSDAICSLLKDIQNNLDNCDASDTKKIEKIIKKISKTLGDCDDTSVCSELLIIDNKIDILMSECSLMPVPDNGIIDVPGSYCLGSIFDSTITISANNVTLDLNRYTIAPINDLNNGITVESNFNNFHIKNGFIVGGLSGILINDGCNAFTISDIEVSKSNNIGINIANANTGIKNFTIKNCTVKNTVNRGFSIERATHFILDNCTAENCSLSAIFSGFDLTNTSSALIYNCLSQKNNGDGFIIESSTNIIMKDCIAQNNTRTGFDFDTSFNFTIDNCIAQSNDRDGFNASSTTSSQIKSCNALNNTDTGFDNTSGTNNLFVNNCALHNNPNYTNVTDAPLTSATDTTINYWKNYQS